jgi:catechol 2,3-dioxygenase-like lactoylglutathione lyase family enzyme
MGLNSYKVSAQIAVSDIDRAADFYEGKLGLVPSPGVPGGGRAYPCGSGTVLYLYPAPAHAGKSAGTLARFDVEDIEGAVAELSQAGVRFERYDEPVKTDERGIHDSGYGKVAWFRDPDGNTFALEQAPFET